MLLFTPFAIGLALVLVGWVVLGLVRSDVVRALARSGWIALWGAPSVIAGHGVAFVPAYFFLLEEPLHPFGWIPIGVVWVLAAILTLSIGPLRRLRTERPLDLGRVLVHPAYPKLFLYGVEMLLLFGALFEPISAHWPAQFLFLFAGGVPCFLLCRRAARHGRTEMVLPLAFAAPIGVSGVFAYAILWYLAGLAGQLVATRRPERALWLGAGTFAVLSFVAVRRTFTAIEYRDASWVTIQGGVAGNAGIAAACVLLTVLCLLFVRTARRRRAAAA